MINLLITWVIIGGFVGFSVYFLNLFSSRRMFFASIFMGIAGAALGGAMGVFSSSLNLSAGYISPMLYSLTGAAFLSLLPIRSKLF